jgi:acyl-CoA thioesterase-1
MLVAAIASMYTEHGRDEVRPVMPETVPPSAVETARVGSTTVIVMFGDSITAGYGISLPEAFPAQLERALRAKGYAVDVINAGVSGETTAGGLRRAEFIAAQGPDIIVLALGGNDVLRGIDPASTKANLAGAIEIFQRAGIRVVIAGMYAPSNLGDAYVADFNAIYPALANAYDIALVPFLLQRVALDRELNQRDGIHPNAEGARIIAEENVLPVLLPVIDKTVRDKK